MSHQYTYELCDTVSLDVYYRAFPDDLNPDDLSVEIDAVYLEGVDIKDVVECLDPYTLGSMESQAIKHFLDTNDYIDDYSDEI